MSGAGLNGSTPMFNSRQCKVALLLIWAPDVNPHAGTIHPDFIPTIQTKCTRFNGPGGRLSGR